MKKVFRVMLIGLCLAAFVSDGFAQRTIVRASIFRERSLPFKPTPRGAGKAAVGFDLNSLKSKKGILSCDLAGVNCVVMNMPLLNQGDSRIDNDVADMKNWGCYDTSIVTVIATALANRNKSLAFGGRTKIFDQITGDSNAPKEVKQISYQYRLAKRHQAGEIENGKVIQPLYFHEAVADFNQGKILQQCDPYMYGNCDKLSNPAQATNLFADAFRTWINPSTGVTNEDIIKLMEQGYVVMIAYVRYEWKYVWNAAKKAHDVSFTRDSFHKVVFSGFRKGEKYPLVINDVGNGTQYNVRISNDIKTHKYPSKMGLSPNSTYSLPTEDTGASTGIFIEYEDLPDLKAFFLDHYDALRIKQ